MYSCVSVLLYAQLLIGLQLKLVVIRHLLLLCLHTWKTMSTKLFIYKICNGVMYVVQNECKCNDYGKRDGQFDLESEFVALSNYKVCGLTHNTQCNQCTNISLTHMVHKRTILYV